MTTANGDICPIEDILIFKIKNGFLLVSPGDAICDFSFIIPDKGKEKCYRKKFDSKIIEKKNLFNTDYDIEFIEDKCFIILGPVKYEMEEEKKEIVSILATLQLKRALIKVDYARNAKMIGNLYNGNPVTGGSSNKNVYTQTPAGSYLVFEFEPCTINFISFTLWNGDDRTYNYHVEARRAGQWIPLFVNQFGKGYTELSFKPIHQVSAIRFTGTSTANNFFHLLECDFSIKYNLEI